MLLGGGKGGVDTVLEDGAVEQRGRRARTGKRAKEEWRQAPRGIRVKLALEGKDVAPEPRKQIEPGTKTCIRPLGQMGVQIDEPRHDDERPNVDRAASGSGLI